MVDGIASDDPAAASRAPVSWFRSVTFYSVLAGLCPLIPVPFLDDRVLAAVERRMTTALARERGVALTERQRDLLSGTLSVSRGCLARAGGLAYALTVKLVGKLFRKLLIFFAVKEAVDVASRTFHEGYLLHLLFDPATSPDWRPDGSPGGSDRATDEAAWKARWAIERAVEETDPRPVNQAIKRAFRGSRGLLEQSARVLARAVRSGRRGDAEREAAAVEAAEGERLAGVVDPLANELWIERAYLEGVEARFRDWYGTAETPPAPGDTRRT